MEKVVVSVVLKKENQDRLRYIREKFGVSMSSIIDACLDEFFYRYRREIDSEDFMQWFEKYIQRQREEKEEEKKKGWFF